MKTQAITVTVTAAELTEQTSRIMLERYGSCSDWISYSVAQSCETDCGEDNLCPKCIDDHGCGGRG
jgi:hypothetical protein